MTSNRLTSLIAATLLKGDPLVLENVKGFLDDDKAVNTDNKAVDFDHSENLWIDALRLLKLGIWRRNFALKLANKVQTNVCYRPLRTLHSLEWAFTGCLVYKMPHSYRTVQGDGCMHKNLNERRLTNKSQYPGNIKFANLFYSTHSNRIMYLLEFLQNVLKLCQKFTSGHYLRLTV